jgi:hypothetical protein
MNIIDINIRTIIISTYQNGLTFLDKFIKFNVKYYYIAEKGSTLNPIKNWITSKGFKSEEKACDEKYCSQCPHK